MPGSRPSSPMPVDAPTPSNPDFYDDETEYESNHIEHSEVDDSHIEHAEHAEHVEHSHVEHSHVNYNDFSESQLENTRNEHAKWIPGDLKALTEEEPTDRPRIRRRSTIVLDDEDEIAKQGSADYEMDHEMEAEGPLSRAGSGDELDLRNATASQQNQDGLVETVLEWKQGGEQVFVTGSFTGWRQMIPLRKVDSNVFAVVLKLAPGTHRLRFVIDGEQRCSDYANTATDSMGNLVNYVEVKPNTGDESQVWSTFDEKEAEAEVLHYSSDIPDIFLDPEVLNHISPQEFTTPPQLPPHLDGVILNTNWNEKDNNSALPIPHHVVLNHLATTSIRHNVLAVASVSRYAAKYVTQTLYTPL